MHLKLILIICTLLLVFNPNYLYAKNVKTFHIEVIIFEHLNSANKNLELWRNHTDLPDSKNALILQPAENNSIDIKNYPLCTALPSNFLLMNKDYYALEKNKNYRVIYHTGWHQKLKFNKFNEKVYITGGKNFGKFSHGLVNEWEIKGIINFKRGHHIHSNVDLIFNTEDSSVQNSNWSFPFDNHLYLKNFRIKQGARLKIKHYHYFDHPRFGVLLAIKNYNP